ncbi:unnamed protein product [Schistosoma mattheei]|uniref:Uncharacterized protein n=1 Tax=Schistosoma mattheei TaxID=31246 RepID=A0A183PA09_9TREM|nr:unnamed protein product [Schistosoma mattheei]
MPSHYPLSYNNGKIQASNSKYIESLVVVRRMLSLEKQYMSETIALVKEVQQPSNLPSGSLISVPITNTQLSQQRKTPDITNNPARMKQLDTGLQYVRRVRRQFCRTEHDAAIIALTSGVIGAGPYAIAQVGSLNHGFINIILNNQSELILDV